MGLDEIWISGYKIPEPQEPVESMDMNDVDTSIPSFVKRIRLLSWRFGIMFAFGD